VCWVQPGLMGTYFSEIIISHWYITHILTPFLDNLSNLSRIHACFISKTLQKLKLQTYFQYLLYVWIKTTQWTKMQVPPSLQRQIRIVELLLYLPSCKKFQVLSDAWDHLKNCTNTNSIQSHHFHIHVTVKLSL